MSQQQDLAIGIDLGTTYCCCAVYKDGEVHVIPNDVGKNTTPSYVTLTTEQNFVGEVSKQLAHENPFRTICDVKRLIGRKFVDPKVQRDMTLWPFQVTSENLLPKIKIDSSTYFPEEISAKLLHYLKECAEDFLGQPVQKAVITVPAYFNDGGRQATRDAGKIAGLQVLSIINEPTAAAMAYNFQKKFSEQNTKKNCLIFDLGGGTFDVSILSMHGGRIEVRSVDGHTHLGGQDFDNAMVHHCIEQFRKKYGIDLNEKRRLGSDIERKRAVRGLRRLKAVCEEQKKYLSATTRVNVGLFAFYEGKDLTVPFDRDLFNRLNDQKFQHCIKIVQRAIESSGMSKADISDVVLVGGSSRIPRVQEMLRDLFQGHSAVLRTQIDPDPEEAVAYGAAIKAYQDCTNNSDVANLRGINAENKENVIRQITISDVIPLAIGIRFVNHMAPANNNDNDDPILDDSNQGTIVIPRNTRIPCSRVFQYKIPKNLNQNERCIPFSVFEGEKKVHGGGGGKSRGGEENGGVENHLIGNFKISPPPSSTFIQEEDQVIDLTLKVDADGILHVAAVLLNGSEEERRIDLDVKEDKGRLTGEDIEKLSSPSLVQEIERRREGGGHRQKRNPKDRVSDLTARFILMALYGDSDQTKRRVDFERQRRQEREAKEIEEQLKSHKIHEEEEEVEKESIKIDQGIQGSKVDSVQIIRPMVLEKQKPKSKRAKAIYDFESRESNEISFQLGDLITDIVTDESGWWFGKCKEQEGYFPFNYVEQIM